MKEYNIIKDYEIINAWKDQASFPVGIATDREKQELRDLAAFVVFLEGTGGDNTIFAFKYDKFVSLAERIIFPPLFPLYLYKSDFKPQLHSRLRSYKGIFRKELPEKEYCEVEAPISSDYSLIAGVAKLNEIIFNKYINIGIDSAHSFVIATDEMDFFTKSNISFIIEECMSHKGMSELNYLKLIIRYCLKGAIIYRFSGDGGDGYFSLQIFCCKAHRPLVLGRYENSILLS
jgi:hypothetical protein